MTGPLRGDMFDIVTEESDEPVLQVYVPPPCPDCAAGKCGNCLGDTWDEVADAPTVCPCHVAGHPPD